MAKWLTTFRENTSRTKAAQALTITDYRTRLNLLESYWTMFSANHFTLAGEEVDLEDQPYFKDNVYDTTAEKYL